MIYSPPLQCCLEIIVSTDSIFMGSLMCQRAGKTGIAEKKNKVVSQEEVKSSWEAAPGASHPEAG